VAYDTTTRLFVAVALNGDAPAEAAANKLIGVVTAWRGEAPAPR
jgi:hypothetical protein